MFGVLIISAQTGRLSIKIADKSGKTRDVSVDRLKIFKSHIKNELIDWKLYEQQMQSAIQNQPNLSEEEDDDVNI